MKEYPGLDKRSYLLGMIDGKEISKKEIDKLTDMLCRTIDHYGCEDCKLDNDIQEWWRKQKCRN